MIGRCHSDGVGAYKLLQWEGFEFDRTVDIFDGGPLVAVQRRHLRTIRESKRVKLQLVDDASNTEFSQGLISTDVLSDFRVSQAQILLRDQDTAMTSQDVFDRLQLKPGATVRVWVRS